MRRIFTFKRAVVMLLLTFGWCVLWGRVTFANVASGLIVAALAAGFSGASGYSGGIRPVPLLRFGVMVLMDLLRSTANVAWEIMTPTDYTEESIVAVHVPPAACRHLLLLIVAITLTPGTAVVDVDAEVGVLYLHLLHHDRRRETEAHVVRLADLAGQAFPPARQSVPVASRPLS